MSPRSSSTDPVEKMNRMYRWTRHVYDLTRRYYLLGRDSMLKEIASRPPGTVLEIGCGTARNLRVLAELAPHHNLYGIDASLSMLATARSKLERNGLHDRITLGHGLAQSLAPDEQIGIDSSFDVIFFSYVLSMIPSWPAALRSALSHLSPDGRLYIVDFWDQGNLPSWFAKFLQAWLAQFDVYPRPDLLRTLAQLDEIDDLSATVEPVSHRYAYRAIIEVETSVPRTAMEVLGASTSDPTESKRFGSSEIIAG